jgi:hypothetical protein
MKNWLIVTDVPACPRTGPADTDDLKCSVACNRSDLRKQVLFTLN